MNRRGSTIPSSLSSCSRSSLPAAHAQHAAHRQGCTTYGQQPTAGRRLLAAPWRFGSLRPDIKQAAGTTGVSSSRSLTVSSDHADSARPRAQAAACKAAESTLQRYAEVVRQQRRAHVAVQHLQPQPLCIAGGNCFWRRPACLGDKPMIVKRTATHQNGPGFPNMGAQGGDDEAIRSVTSHCVQAYVRCIAATITSHWQRKLKPRRSASCRCCRHDIVKPLR